MTTDQRLVDLYEEMYQHTRDECACSCKVPHSCCSPEYCEIAEDIMEEKNECVEKTGHSRLPYMGDNGCVVPPHLRPLCTVHTCEVNGFARKIGDQVWTEKYFQIRDKISMVELGD